MSLLNIFSVFVKAQKQILQVLLCQAKEMVIAC